MNKKTDSIRREAAFDDLDVGISPADGWDRKSDFPKAIQIVRDAAGMFAPLREQFGDLYGPDALRRSLKAVSTELRDLGIHPVTAAKWIVKIGGLESVSVATLAREIAGHYSKQISEAGRLCRHDALTFQDDGDAEDGDDTSPLMEFDKLKLPELLDHAEASLIGAGVPLYRMENRLVHTYRFTEDLPDSATVQHKAGALIVDDVGQHRLLEYFVKHAKFYVTDKDGAPKDIAPPLSLATHYLARMDQWRLPALRGVIQAPTLRADGSLLTEPGYDRASGLLLDSHGIEFPPIKGQPDRDDALDALAILKDVFKDFPFVEGEHFERPSLSVALSAVLTGLIRRTLPSAPAHAFSAPEAGTGKTLACNVACMIITGHEASVLNFSASDEEVKKMLFAAFLGNPAFIQIDNVTRPIEGNSLCSALTEGSLSDRILGESRNATVATNALITITGNNLKIKGDMVRRTIMCRMDAGEHPEEREFDVDLKTEVPKRRPQLVAAGLTILRAFIVAGRPGADRLSSFGSFEDWSRLVRGALVWLGEADPCDSRELVREDDSELQDFAALLMAIHRSKIGWFKVDSLLRASESIRMDDTIEAARSDEGNDDFEEPSDVAVSLPEAIEACVPDASKKSFGKFLAKNRDRVIGGLRLNAMHDKKHHTWRYCVIPE